jgi:hypothetical protein
MITKSKTQVSDIIKEARQIAADANKPMSPAQIKAKFQLSFPFTVKRVVLNNTPSACKHDSTGQPGETITFLFENEDLKVYIFHVGCGCIQPSSGLKLSHLGIESDSERFVLV